MTRFPVSPQEFFFRVKVFAVTIAVIQLFHLIFITDTSNGVYLTWLFVNFAICTSIWILSNKVGAQGKNFVHIPWRALVSVLFIAFIFKMTSRMDHITSTLNHGLNVTHSGLVPSVSYASYINIFFYPAAILLSFTVLPKRVYQASLVLIFVICFVDFLFVGTRNAPTFVLLFIFMTMQFRYSIKNLLKVLAVVVSFVVIFSNSTVTRGSGEFDWLEAFRLTTSTQVLHINEDVASSLEEHAPTLFPLVFLMHYGTHSLGELDNMIETINELPLGGANYIVDQFCVVGFCSREDSLGSIKMANPRSAAYQTIFSSLFYDFGVIQAGFIWVLMLIFLCLRQKIMRDRVGVDTAVFLVILMVGSIENYFYNGLNLVQILMIFLLLFVFWIYQNIIIRGFKYEAQRLTRRIPG